MQTLSWFELARDAKEGDRVLFMDHHDIFPECMVPAGTRGTVVENSLNEMHCGLLVRPDTPSIREHLSYWDGCIVLGEHLNSAADLESDQPTDEAAEWFELSPLAMEDHANA